MKKPMKAAGPLIFAAAIAAAVLISVSGIRCYAVLTGSMEPVLPVGSLLVVVPMSFDELKVGQDITYKTAGGTVTHRIVAIDQAARTVTTQGLTNNVADTPVTAENIVGRVHLCLPWMGYPVKILNDTKRSFALEKRKKRTNRCCLWRQQGWPLCCCSVWRLPCWHKERRENLLLTSGAASLKRILRKVTAQRIRRKTKHQLPRHQRLYRHRMKARRFPTQRRKVPNQAN